MLVATQAIESVLPVEDSVSKKQAHLVVSGHISLQVKYLTQVCEGEKQSQLLSIYSPLGFWRRIKHMRFISVTGFCSFRVVEHHVLKMTFHHNVQKNLFHISTNVPAFCSGILVGQRAQNRYCCPSANVSHFICRVFR